MQRIFRIGFKSLALMLLMEISFASQSSPKSVPSAPVPAPVLTAKRIFISNFPSDALPESLGGTNRIYNEFYAAVKDWGRYDLVSNPADADLVIEISFTDSLSGVGGTSSTGCSSSTAKYLRLAILDAKIGVPLWWFAEHVEQQTSFGHRPETLDAALTRSIGSLVDDLKKLTEPAATQGTGPR